MKILVLNAGSSSQKSCVFDLAEGAPLPDTPPAPLWQAHVDGGPETLASLLAALWEGPSPVLASPGEIAVVGHRVVHGGGEYVESAWITPGVRAVIARLAPLAPAHNPAALAGIEAIDRLFGDVPQIAVFDTAFHSTMPDAAAIYPGPYAWWERGLRRYGFHGISHQYCARRAAQILGRDLDGLRLISCHLGNGCSLAAIRNGWSVDTTMGFTPLEGLMMGTRSGTIDPGLLLHLLRTDGITPEQLDTILNRESGLLGVSGVSGDLRDVLAARDRGDERARLALDVYVHRLRYHIGAMAASLGGLDALVFTAGVGENSAEIRARACEPFGFLGVALDERKNGESPHDADIATTNSAVRVLVIHTEEDWEIARECRRLHDAAKAH